ncbi:MAG: type II/IV secretion system ATPase subunit, partial [Candidatus Bathyarchaeia archaeon]
MGFTNVSRLHLGVGADLTAEGEQKPPAEGLKPAEGQKREGFSLFKKKKVEVAKPTVVLAPVPPEAKLIEEYWIREPHSKVSIVALPQLGGAKAYYITEVTLSAEERQAYERLIDILSRELEPPKTEVADAKAYVLGEARRLAAKYRGAVGKFDEAAWDRILYHIERDLIGFGFIEVPMSDPRIEDISANGVGIPVYIWHRRHESLPTNLMFTEEKALDDLIIKLAHLSGKHVSTAFPIVDAMLPGQHRLAATFKQEVSPKGTSFTIRKFREEPFSIIDLIELGTLDERIAAYFWLLLENRNTLIVIGGTGAGKTSTLNALASLVKPSMKIVTVEEIPELNLPHENWVQLVARESYGLGLTKTGEVSLFDLVRTSLRYRPDYIVVGEVRGAEAFVLFQAMATGHGGMCTLHAENLDYAVKRLTSPPMNVAHAYIPLMNLTAIVER